MLDTACILLSTLVCIFVAVRAVMLDARVPWFERVGAPDVTAGAAPASGGGWRQRAVPAEQPVETAPRRPVR